MGLSFSQGRTVQHLGRDTSRGEGLSPRDPLIPKGLRIDQGQETRSPPLERCAQFILQGLKSRQPIAYQADIQRIKMAFSDLGTSSASSRRTPAQIIRL
jgi:hypothetical protein